MTPVRLIAIATVAATSFGQAAAADGEFLQIDLGAENRTLVAQVSRGAVGYGLTLAAYDGGRSGAVGVTYALPLAGVATLKAGPTIGFQDDDGNDRDVQAGVRLSVERYTPTSFGSTFALADISSVNRSWFVLGQVTFQRPGITVELSRGGSDSYDDATLTIQKRIPGGPVSLRAGYRLMSDEVFAGISINTF